MAVGVQDSLIDAEVAPINCVLDRTHPLPRLRYALEIEVSSILPQNLKHVDIAGSDSEEHTAEAFVLSLLINVNCLLPDDGFIDSLRSLQFLHLHPIFLFCFHVFCG